MGSQPVCRASGLQAGRGRTQQTSDSAVTGIAYGRPIVVTHRTRPQHGLPLVRGEEHGRSQDRVGALRALRIAEDGEIQHSLSTSPDILLAMCGCSLVVGKAQFPIFPVRPKSAAS